MGVVCRKRLEHGNEVVLDFVGYDDPGHFLGKHAQLAAIMHSEDGVCGAAGHLRRYVLSPASGRLSETILSDSNFEFPSADGRLDAYDFGEHVNAGEPVFAANPDGGADQGGLITQTLDTRRGTSEFAILDVRDVAAGPVATIELGETMPISFHGQWDGR